VIQYIVDADAQLRNIDLLKELRIGDLAETIRCRPLASAAESLISHLRGFVAGVAEDSLDNRYDLLDKLDTALDSFH